ncbi:hypothetical protein T4A_11859 [Trichinella pseudospiralis]|uniref:Uncharacterized protein n=1 Tax=Trichinella pseudospiralis TaxID=6337 RepID=A0A0V1E0I3_TRIPS|nr:hypothetical protein T4A_11859 [Trichinella pseudospiralis]
MSELVSSFAVGTHQLQKRVQLQMRYAMVGEYSIPHACCFFFHIMWPFCEANPVHAAAGAFPLANRKKNTLKLNFTKEKKNTMQIRFFTFYSFSFLPHSYTTTTTTTTTTPTLIFAPFPDDELTSNKEMSLLLTNTALQMVVLKI